MNVDKIIKYIRTIIKKDSLESQILDLKYVEHWLKNLIEEKELKLKPSKK